MPLALLVTAIILALQARAQSEELRRAVGELRHRLDRLESSRRAEPSAPAPTAAPTPASEPAPVRVLPVVAAPAAPAPVATHAPDPTPPRAPEFAPAPAAPRADPPQISLEERVGSRLYVWIGAIAFACGGVLLVKYSIDRNLLSPTVRVALGVLLGIALLALGERWRGRNLGAAVSAAGVCDLFACLLASVHLYGLIGPVTGFALMIALTALAIWLSLRQGPAVALLGLAGGFITPALLGSQEPRALPLLAWCLVLQGALLFLARARRWEWIGWLSVGAALAWSAVWLFGPLEAARSPWLGPYLLGSLALTFATARGAGGDGGWTALRAVTAFAVLPLLVLLVRGGALSAGGFSAIDWTYLGCASLGLIVFARMRESEHALAWLGLAAPLAALASAHHGGALSPAHGAWLAVAFGVATALCAYVGASRGRNEGAFAALAVCALLGHLLLAWWELPEAEWTEFAWALAAFAIAVACAAAAAASLRRRGASDRHAGALAAYCAGASAAVALALGFALRREWIAAAVALEIPCVLALSARLRVPALRRVALALLVACAAQLARAPFLVEPPHEHLSGWLLFGYGVPVCVAVIAARQLVRAGSADLAEVFACAALVAACVLACFEVRALFHPGLELMQCLDAGIGARESGLWAAAWLAAAAAAVRVTQVWPRSVLRVLALVACAGALLVNLIGLYGRGSLWTHERVGEWPIFNALLVIVGLPLAGWCAVAFALRACGWRIASALASVVALGFGFMLVTFEVRQGFRGTLLGSGAGTAAETYAYSAAWLAYGAVLLGLGIRTRSALLRWASLVVMLVVIAKVFLYDLSELRDLWRVASFLGLGVCAIAIGWVYQRFVFPRGSRG
ncbi:MAG: DUF2339 domain-containing protein [Planctomycetota bacterium]|nr:MAG: DUF2339 domain-containing protein [Planctomycetota bacterium]